MQILAFLSRTSGSKIALTIANLIMIKKSDIIAVSYDHAISHCGNFLYKCNLFRCSEKMGVLNQLPLCRIYASVNSVNIVSGNGLLPVWRQAITRINHDLLPIGPIGTKNGLENVFEMTATLFRGAGGANWLTSYRNGHIRKVNVNNISRWCN